MTLTPLNELDCWIFDMDGTLTIAAHDFDAIRKELGIHSGKPILEAIDAMPENDAATATHKLHQLELDVAAQTRAQPDAIELLEHLHGRGVHLGILTRNAKDIADVTLRAAGIKQYFDDSMIVGREQCAPKPDPAGIKWLMTQCSSATDQTIMVGDYWFDLKAGKSAGVTTAHFDVEGHYPWPQLTDYRVDSLRQLIVGGCPNQ